MAQKFYMEFNFMVLQLAVKLKPVNWMEINYRRAGMFDESSAICQTTIIQISSYN